MSFATHFATHGAADFVTKTAREMKALAPAELIELVSKQESEIVKQGREIAMQEHEIVNLRRQVAWFQRLIFGQKSEKRLPASTSSRDQSVRIHKS